MKRTFSIFAAVLLSALCALALVPRQMSYQGSLTTDDTGQWNYLVDFLFAIYPDSVGDSLLWQEEHVSVQVLGGVFQVILGQYDPLPTSLDTVGTLWLEAAVNGQILTPRSKFLAVPYAFTAVHADTASFATSGTGESLWQVGTGQAIYYNGGNVGIGTASPQEKLDIAGTTVAGNVMAKFTDTNGQNLTMGFSIPNKFMFTQSGGPAGVPMTFDLTNGCVGIGTDSPAYRLDVSGGHSRIRGAYSLFLNNSADDAIAGIYNNGLPGQAGLAFEVPAGTPRLIVSADGNVGIGTTSPTSTLDVRGLGQVTDAGVWPDGSFYATFGVTRANVPVNNSYIGLTKGGVIPWGIGIDASGDANFIIGVASSNPARTIPNPLITIHPWTGNVGIGTTSPGYKLDAAGPIRSSSGGFVFPDGSVQTTASVGGSSYWAPSGSNIYNTNSGNVGIGTNNPGDKLEVSGSTKLANRIKFSQNGYWADLDLLTGHPSSYPRLYIYETPGGGTRIQTGQYGEGVLTVKGLRGITDSNSDGSVAIIGEETATTGNVFGVMGTSNSSTNGVPPGQPGAGSTVGVYGRCYSSISRSGATLGVLGRIDANYTEPGSDIAAAVFGWAPGVSTGNPQQYSARCYGVWGETWSNYDLVSGVYGVNKATTGQTRGTIGVVLSTAAGAAGVLGSAPSSGAVRGVMGYCHSSSGYAVYSDGNFAVAPGYTKSGIVETSKGTVKMYCQESPEIWFEDFGEGRLSNGKAHIILEPLFMETVTIDDAHPAKVFVQLRDDCKGVYVKTAKTGFDVVELQGGASNATFSYRVVAKRKGFEGERLARTEVVNLEP